MRNHIYKEVHPRNRLTPKAFSALDVITKIWWKCGRGHEWEAKIHTRLYGKGNCPACMRLVEPECSLGFLFPEIAADWHEKNVNSPRNTAPGSKTKVWWRCHVCLHEWQTQVRSRTNHKTKCPNCYTPNRSEREIKISFELKHCFDQVDITQQRLTINDKIIGVDIFLPQYKLAIEYDGSTTHANTLQRDVEKNKKLTEAGYRVMRIREKPLAPTTSSDLLIDKKTSIKMCVDQLLRHLRETFQITSSRYDSYLKRKLCVNTSRANNFISNQKLAKIIEGNYSLAKEIEFNDRISFDNEQLATLSDSFNHLNQRMKNSVRNTKYLLGPLPEATLVGLNEILTDDEVVFKAKKILDPTPPASPIELEIPSSYKPIIGYSKPQPNKPQPIEVSTKTDEQLISRYKNLFPHLDATAVLVEAQKIEKIKRELLKL